MLGPGRVVVNRRDMPDVNVRRRRADMVSRCDLARSLRGAALIRRASPAAAPLPGPAPPAASCSAPDRTPSIEPDPGDVVADQLGGAWRSIAGRPRRRRTSRSSPTPARRRPARQLGENEADLPTAARRCPRRALRDRDHGRRPERDRVPRPARATTARRRPSTRSTACRCRPSRRSTTSSDHRRERHPRRTIGRAVGRSRSAGSGRTRTPRRPGSTTTRRSSARWPRAGGRCGGRAPCARTALPRPTRTTSSSATPKPSDGRAGGAGRTGIVVDRSDGPPPRPRPRPTSTRIVMEHVRQRRHAGGTGRAAARSS